MVDIGEDMAAKPKKDPLAALMALPGVGKATASGRKVAEKTAKSSGDNRVKSSKSDDGRKGKTLNIPRNLKDMPWFRKK